MIWCPIPPPWRSRLALLLLATVGLVSAAQAQDDQTQERLDRLERDLNMLQRQVYRGGGSAGGSESGADPSIAVNTQIRLDRLEQEIRELTGRVEDTVNQINQLHQRVEQINGDVQARFNEASAQPPAPAGAPARPGAAAAASGLRPPAERNPALASPAPARTATLAGTLTPPGTLVPPPAPAAPVAAAAEAPPGGALPAGSAAEQYNFAFGLLKQADYPAAERAFKAFVAQHPKDVILAGNAQYWLGETYYARGRYIEAAATFAEAYKNYPSGPRAADDLLKLAISLDKANQHNNACLALGQLDHDFPHSAGAIKERAAAEKKRLGC